MEHLHADILIKLALILDLDEVLNLCYTSTKINNKICSNNIFWIKRLEQDYNINYYKLFPKLNNNSIEFYYTPKEVYEYCGYNPGAIGIDEISKKYWPLFVKLETYFSTKGLYENKTIYVVYSYIWGSDNIKIFLDKKEAIDVIITDMGSFFLMENLNIDFDELNRLYGVNNYEDYRSKYYNIFSKIDDTNFITYDTDDLVKIMILAKYNF